MLTTKAVWKRFHAAFFRFLDVDAMTGNCAAEVEIACGNLFRYPLRPAYGANFIATLVNKRFQRSLQRIATSPQAVGQNGDNVPF